MVIINKTLKEIVYGKGTIEQIEFLAELGGMTEEETELFKLLHYGKSDLYIMQKLNLSNRPFLKVEQNVRLKLTIAVFTCISRVYEEEQKRKFVRENDIN